MTTDTAPEGSAGDGSAGTVQMDADRINLDLKEKEAQVEKLRTALNTAKTNKEYAAILTQINTFKADNAKLEEEVLKIMQDVDAVKAQAEKISVQVEAEQKRLGILARVPLASGLLSGKYHSGNTFVGRDVRATFDPVYLAYDEQRIIGSRMGSATLILGREDA